MLAGRLIYDYFLMVRAECHSEFENFSSPNYSNFAVECDCNSKISQNVIFFSIKICTGFCKIGKCGKFAVECVSNDISQKCLFHLNCEVFARQKFIIFRKIIKYMKSIFLKNKNVFILLKSTFNKIGGRKIYR